MFGAVTSDDGDSSCGDCVLYRADSPAGEVVLQIRGDGRFFYLVLYTDKLLFPFVRL